MQQQFINDHRLKFIIGDIRDKDQLVYACQGVHYVFHLAAFKNTFQYVSIILMKL